MIQNINQFDEYDDTTIHNMNKLFELYKIFLLCVQDEKKILNIDDIDFLDDIIRQKDLILNQIDETRKLIDFNIFKDIDNNSEKKIKANVILSDIHRVMNEIITLEDENRVELQSLKEKMKLDIIRQDKGAKVVSQFEQTIVKSHFIDTKK